MEDIHKPETNSPPEAPDTAFHFESAATWAGRVAAVLVGVLFVFAGVSVWDLFSARLGAGPLESALAVTASVFTLGVILAVVLTSRHPNLRGLGAVWLIAWSLLTLALVAANAALRGWSNSVPVALANLGGVFAALLAGLALLPAITLPLAAADRDPADSAAGAAAKYVGFVAKAAGIGASVFASAYFGLSRGMDPTLAVLCGFVLESCFVWAYLSLTRAKARADVFDVILWGAAVVAFGLFIAAVSVETLSSLAGIAVPLVAALGEFGASLYVSAVGLALLLTIVVHVLTAAIDIAPKRAPKPAPLRVSPVRPMALAQEAPAGPVLVGQPAPEADTATMEQNGTGGTLRAGGAPEPSKSGAPEEAGKRRSTEILGEW